MRKNRTQPMQIFLSMIVGFCLFPALFGEVPCLWPQQVQKKITTCQKLNVLTVVYVDKHGAFSAECDWKIYD